MQINYKSKYRRHERPPSLSRDGPISLANCELVWASLNRYMSATPVPARVPPVYMQTKVPTQAVVRLPDLLTSVPFLHVLSVPSEVPKYELEVYLPI